MAPSRRRPATPKEASKPSAQPRSKGKPDVLRFEGHDYTIVDSERPGITAFEKVPGSDAPVRSGACATADVTDSGEGWCYLPRRVAPPVGGDVDETTGKYLTEPHPRREAIRAHPAYAAGRDDLAIRAVESGDN